MGEVHELQLHIRDPVEFSQESVSRIVPSVTPTLKPIVDLETEPRPKNFDQKWRWWLLLLLFAVLILSGQTVGTLLGRFYFVHGGNSTWMLTLIPASAVVLVIPLLLLVPFASHRRPSSIKFAGICIILGLLGTGDNLMFNYGIRYLPVSTFSLLCSTGLAFNAFFAYLLNSQKFTPYIFNSVIILTLAAVLLGVHSDGGSASSNKYPLGVTLTLAASALAGFILSLTQLTIKKVLKAKTMAIVMEMMLWTGVVTALACIVGLFASGQWRGIHEEFVGFDRGRVSYLMTLIWIGVSWLSASVGFLGMIYSISSLFANVIGTLGLPLVPIFAVVFFHEKMDGVKVVALLMAVLGFANYMYQHYLDDMRERNAAHPLMEVKHDHSAVDSVNLCDSLSRPMYRE
ncbi:putative purine permease 11 [Platanthera guangdongensis]|uniref:Probable purine permease n=1 Tax=Platanthera guangdongensis TaxID=2320717 RepID=A0ABR2MIP8_9ASPA